MPLCLTPNQSSLTSSRHGSYSKQFNRPRFPATVMRTRKTIRSSKAGYDLWCPLMSRTTVIASRKNNWTRTIQNADRRVGSDLAARYDPRWRCKDRLWFLRAIGGCMTRRFWITYYVAFFLLSVGLALWSASAAILRKGDLTTNLLQTAGCIFIAWVSRRKIARHGKPE